jgi:hypothetical protein
MRVHERHRTGSIGDCRRDRDIFHGDLADAADVFFHEWDGRDERRAAGFRHCQVGGRRGGDGFLSAIQGL